MNWGALVAAGERQEGFVIFWQQLDLTKRGIGVEFLPTVESWGRKEEE
jgi:hypothetical protein